MGGLQRGWRFIPDLKKIDSDNFDLYEAGNQTAGGFIEAWPLLSTNTPDTDTVMRCVYNSLMNNPLVYNPHFWMQMLNEQA